MPCIKTAFVNMYCSASPEVAVLQSAGAFLMSFDWTFLFKFEYFFPKGSQEKFLTFSFELSGLFPV